MQFKWNIPGKAKDGIDILRYIAEERNFSKEQIKQFINNLQKPHDPYLFEDMKEVVNRINLAIKTNEKICVIGDYDCDGITSTYTMYMGLKYLNANVIYKLPHRVKNGYGLSNKLVDYAKENNTNLIITVDNGIAAAEVVDYAKQLGIDVIVTDHHEPKEILPNCLIINPKVSNSYPFNGICGCGSAFKTISCLIPDFENSDIYEQLLEILAIGTIADAMELIDENRTFVIEGLKLLNNTKNIGLKCLFEKTGLSDKVIDVISIGYIIGPNINAAGRLESPDIAMDLLLSDDEFEAEKLANKLIKLNEKRKDLQSKVVEGLEVNNEDNCLIEIIDECNAGIAGIIASKVVETYHKPCFILHQKNEILSGSGRTFDKFNLVSCIENHKDIVIGGGGHESACGVSINKDNIDKFRQACNKEFDDWLKNNPDKITPSLNVTCETDFNLLDKRLISNINRLQPFGNGNLEPTFATFNAKATQIKIVGKNLNTIQFNFEKNNIKIKAVGFSKIKEKYDKIGDSSEYDILYKIGLNEWPKGIFNVQLIIDDIKVSDKNVVK